MEKTIGWQDLFYPGRAADFFALNPLPPFDATTREFSYANAWWLAELSRLVYRHDSDEDATPLKPLRTQIQERVGLRQLAFFNSKTISTQAMLVKADQPTSFAVLVFRGTEQDIGDWLCDLETAPTGSTSKGSRVHRGFQRGLDAVWSEILIELDKLDCPLFYAGHSLGAALATLAATRRTPQAVYAFGSPRVGDAKLAEELKATPVFRVVYGGDLVTTVPLESMGFKHAGQEKQFGKRMLFPAITDFRALVKQLSVPIKPLADHAPINYVRAMQAELKQK